MGSLRRRRGSGPRTVRGKRGIGHAAKRSASTDTAFAAEIRRPTAIGGRNREHAARTPESTEHGEDCVGTRANSKVRKGSRAALDYYNGGACETEPHGLRLSPTKSPPCQRISTSRSEWEALSSTMAMRLRVQKLIEADHDAMCRGGSKLIATFSRCRRCKRQNSQHERSSGDATRGECEISRAGGG